MKKLIYPGYMSQECKNFFGDDLVSEEREGCAVVGHFVKLKDNTTRMPSKGDVFIKDNDSKIELL